MDIDHIANVSKEIALNAGKIILEGFYKERDINSVKEFYDFDTVYDKNVEKYVFDQLRKHFPSYKFIGDESTKKNILTDEPTWIIGSIEGTKNFVHGFPYCAISIGLLKDKMSVYGLIYNPIKNETFVGIKGKGAFLNDKPIHVNKTKECNKALVCAEFSSCKDPSNVVDAVLVNMKNIISKVHGVRSLGSVALSMCHVACGRADAYWDFGVHMWDIVAGVVIVEEAGGYVGSPNGKDLDYANRQILCASTPELAKEISMIVHEIPI